MMHPRRSLFIICLLWLMPFLSLAGGPPHRPLEPLRARLLQMADSLAEKAGQQKRHVLETARQKGLSLEFTTREGVSYALVKVENGTPYYLQTHNRLAGATSGIPLLQPGGLRRTQLTGSGLEAAIWDAGSIDTNHREFAGRIRNKNPDRGVHVHPTHVAGTLAAAGVDPDAKGMATEAVVRGYHWANDLQEMAAAAAEGLLLSNHSYGFALGWELRDGEWRWMGEEDAQEDYRFGYYSELSRALDEIAWLAPHYQIVWSAGNHRDDLGDGSRPPDGPFDCLGPHAVAKNVLTVGAVAGIEGGYSSPTDLVMSSFSSWGPTDDGRIKPDLVAMGKDVYSSMPHDAYARSSGTSMASPVVAGSLLLIQELYEGLTAGDMLRAASLRGLAIHTARRAGPSEGPDYSFGWGLLDAATMADFLLALHEGGPVYFKEESLAQGGEFGLDFFADGTGPLLATLAWTDLPGSPLPGKPLNARDPMLINDLDLRLVSASGDTLYPWVLDVENPQAPARQGDNVLDNVEQVYVAAPEAGYYRLIITHKDHLMGGSQDFSLFLQTASLPEPRKNLYWTGGEGDWAEEGKWSYSSGGSPAGRIPGPGDHVVLDAHSFSHPAQVLQLVEKAYCYSLSVETGTLGRLALNGHTLLIQHSLLADEELLTGDPDGLFRFSGKRQDGRVISPAGRAPGLGMEFDHPQGRWRLLSSPGPGSIRLGSGSLIMDGLDIQLDTLYVDENPEFRGLSLRGTALHGLSKVVIPTKGVKLQAEDALFFIGNDSLQTAVNAWIHMPGHRLGTLFNRGATRLSGRLELKHLVNLGELYIGDDLLAHRIRFYPGTSMRLDAGVLLTAGNDFRGSGSLQEPVYFVGSEGAEVASLETRLYCFDHVHVQQLSARGPARFNAGPAGTLHQAPGWFNADCEQVLFADFQIRFPCAHGWTHFEDLSSGYPSSREWTLDGQVVSADATFTRTFPHAGDVAVGLRVWERSGQAFHQHHQTWTIKENPISPFGIRQPRPGFYESEVAALHYQWYRNGEPIPGATRRSYFNTDDMPGAYQVLISDGTCNRPSDNEIVTTVPGREGGGLSLQISPNPASGRVNVHALHPMQSLHVYDMYGKLAYLSFAPGHPHEIDVSAWPRGAYVVHAVTAAKAYAGKLLIVN